MRLLLDAHVSGRRVGRPLRDAGHDIRAAGGEPELVEMEDDDLLELAAREGRVLVTFDVKDFSRLVKEWADEGRSHSGVIPCLGQRNADDTRLYSGFRYGADTDLTKPRSSVWPAPAAG